MTLILMKKINIGILTFPISEAGNIPLSNLLDVLKPFSNNLYLITGNDGYTFFKDDENVCAFGVRYKSSKYTHIRIINYISVQLKISYKLIKLSKSADLWIFFIGGETLLLPMITAKFLRKIVILASAGSSLQCSKLKDFNLSKVIEILESINRSLSNYIVLYSQNIVEESKLEKYAYKISIARKHFLNFSKFKMETGFNKRSNLVGYIGALSEEKGTLEFVEAIPKILKQKNDTEFLIVGDGRLRGYVERYLYDNGLTRKVELAGWISHDEIPKYLNRLKLLVLPSYTEGLPNVMIEAMACGTPVLAHPVGAVPDIINDGETGFLMKNNSPKCISANVVRALDHHDLEGVVQRAQAFVEQEFSYEAAVKSYRSLLEPILLKYVFSSHLLFKI